MSGTVLRIDWREAHKWWSSWGLLIHLLIGAYAGWTALQGVLPWWMYLTTSMLLPVAIWVLAHVNQPGLEDCGDGTAPKQTCH